MHRIYTLLSLSLLVFFSASFAQVKDRKTIFNLSKNNVAISGYDPVAYFTQNKAIEGKKEFSTNANGVVYYFATQTNKDLFKANVAKYEPQYGGWCAYAMGATGEKVEIDPETFKIIDNKLYLFYNKYFNNTLKSWNKDENRLKIKADASWMKFTN